MRIWLFDIDGTLINSRGAGKTATQTAIRKAFGIYPECEGLSFAGRTDRAILSDLFRMHGIPEVEESWIKFQRAYLPSLEISLADRNGHVLDGAEDLLQRVAGDHNNHLGLLTGNVRDGARLKLRHYGLWDRFQFGGFGDHHVSRSSVASMALEAAIRHVGHPVNSVDVWVVGDTVNDVQCARAIGARVIAVATGGSNRDQLAAARPDWLVDSLAEVDSSHD